MSHIQAIIEALLWASDTPLTTKQLAELTGEKDLKPVLNQLREDLQEESHGIELVEINGGYQFRTKAAYGEWIQKLAIVRPVRFSRSAIETLAMVAYRQPITRADIEQLRGVDSGAVLKGLLERQLVKILGRKEEPGRPILYGTTHDFLELFGLKDLKELPPLKDLEEQAAKLREMSREYDETAGDTDLAELAADPEALELLNEQEQEAFSQLDEKLAEMKERDLQAQEAIMPSAPTDTDTDSEESPALEETVATPQTNQ